MLFNQSGPLINLFKHRSSDLLPLTDYQPLYDHCAVSTPEAFPAAVFRELR